MKRSIAICGVSIFDGFRLLPRRTVVIRDGILSAMGEDIAIPVEAQVIDGTGQTLLPGLIDAHTHVIFASSLRQALMFGVTTELDMFMDYRIAREIKQRHAADQMLDMADLRSAGTLATAPGGHGTEYGMSIPTICEPEDAERFVDARISEGSDYIKIIYDSRRAYGMNIPTLSKATMAALVAAAHARGKLAIVHALRLQDARDAIEVGVDGLAHLFIDQAPDSGFGHFLASHRAFMIPTLAMLENLSDVSQSASLAVDIHLAPYLSKEDISGLKSASPYKTNAHFSYVTAQETIRQLKASGVPILAGTDAPNPGTLHGVSMHRELELLVQAGLTPVEALIAATSASASVFGLVDRGRIAPGLRADLLLVRGDPTSNIQATRDIVGIWKRGIQVVRHTCQAVLEQRQTEARRRPAPVGSESGAISDFEDGTTRTAFGIGWSISTDNAPGGGSTASFKVVPDGANGGKGSLFITGEIASKLQFAWAGAIFFPGSTPWSPANLSNKKALTFWTKGDGKAYRVMLFAESPQAMPEILSFVAGSQWQKFSFTFTQFGKIGGHDLLGVLFAADRTPGQFAFHIDDVRFEQ